MGIRGAYSLTPAINTGHFIQCTPCDGRADDRTVYTLLATGRDDDHKY
jgi:hypothetical protein